MKKNILLSSSRALEATWKKATKCNKRYKSLSPIKVSLKHLPQQYFLPKIGTFATLFGSFLKLLPQNRLLLDNIENTKKDTFLQELTQGVRTDKLQTIPPQKRPISQQTPKQKIVGTIDSIQKYRSIQTLKMVK